ncbi:MAG: putative ABC transporter ATP-binding protein [Firmicutes bacterium ADurb.Bin419]|nr:MAG: putative ABC transporter ATP-binding protein [Firmicutes bacterium ADurb.Bin419]
MYKLAKYLKPYTGLILIAIVFLFGQAMADLSLPDYMSKIVNTGIQQGGIENAVPEAIRASRFEKLPMFMSEDDRAEVSGSYELIDKASADYDTYVKKYPALANEPVYVLKEIDDSQIDKLNPILGKAFIAISQMEKMQEEAKALQAEKAMTDVDLSKAGGVHPAEESANQLKEMNEKFAAMDDKMIVQAAASSVRAEYEALGMDVDGLRINYIIRIGIMMLLLSLLSAACVIVVGFISSRTGAGLASNLRRDVFTKVSSFSNEELDKFSTSSLITRTTNDINHVQMLVMMMIRMVFYALIMAVGGVIKAIGKSQSMTWIIAVAVLAILGLILCVFAIALPKFKLIQKLVDRLNLVTRENLSGMMVIRAFNTQKFEEERFDNANQELTSINLFVNRVMVVMFPTMTLVMNIITLLIIWVGANQVSTSSMQVGDMMAFMQYAMQIMFAFLMMSFMFIMIPRASVAAQRIAEVLETDPTIKDPEKPKSFSTNEKGVVEFRNVSFMYHGAEENMLKNISFKALPGQTTAFIGSTGSGKTTLVNLIPRFYDVTEGQVLVDGIDVREVSQHDLREKIGYVPQKSSLFSGTIESNMKYANEGASENDVNKALEIAQAIDFVNEKPEGTKSAISQGGSNVSGGQKQRLSIARALMKKPEIYVFDDSFSALDFKTDSTLRKALKDNIKSSTLLIVAQRISTIMNAEQIIVLDEGRIVGKGTHKELMENCTAYQEIALSQLSKEELA